MKQHKSSAQLKALAKEQLMGKYGIAISVSLLYMAITYIASEISSIFLLVPGLVGTLLYYASVFVITVFTGLFAYGYNLAFLKIACGAPTKPSDIYAGFKANAKEILKAQFVRALISFVFFIPCYVFNETVDVMENPNVIGVYFLLFGLGMLGEFVVTLFYNQTFFIMLDFPDYDAKKALAFSKELMKGNKGRYIYLLVSFIPLYILGICTCCIGLLWVVPYIQTTLAHFYLDLIQNKN